MWSSLLILAVAVELSVVPSQVVTAFECMRPFITPHHHVNHLPTRAMGVIAPSILPPVTRRRSHYWNGLKSKRSDLDEGQEEKVSYNDYKEQLEALSFLSSMEDQIGPSDDDDEDGDADGVSYLCQRAQSTFDEMFDQWVTNDDPDDDLEPTTEIYNLLIDVYARAGSAQKGVEIADSILQKMEDAASGDVDTEVPLPDIDTFLSVMNGWARHRNLEKVHSTFERLKRYHHDVVIASTTDDPHAESYNTLLDKLVHSDISSASIEAEALLREMIGVDGGTIEDDSTDGESSSSTTVMTKEELQKLTVKRLKEMIGDMDIPSTSDAPKGLKLKADFIDYILQHQTQAAPASSNHDRDDTSHTRQLPRPNTRTFYLVLSCILRHPPPTTETVQEKVQQIFNLMIEHCEEDNPPDDVVNPRHTTITNIRIKALGQKPRKGKGRSRQKGGAGAAEEAESLLLDSIALYKKDKHLDVRPDAASFINAINVWRNYRPSSNKHNNNSNNNNNNKAPMRAMNLLSTLEQLYAEEMAVGGTTQNTENLKPDYRVYNAVQYVWARSRSRDKVTETRALLDRMIQLKEETGESDYAPNKRSYNNVINACTFFPKGGRGSDVSEDCKNALRIAVQTFNDMRASDDVHPNHVTYGMLLKAVGALMPITNTKRDTIIENIFRKCCKDGYVSDFVFESFTEVSNELLYQKVIGTVKDDNDDDDDDDDDDTNGVYIPMEWREKVES